jgi:UDP-N-acetylglucosamine diphosphorylase / glucose-1-phosphate thymidylyltransferase / UDP-N-acetylgalactosamine diphosphorylase / glucosamine-1-phosphate N-acetyltransferase / galactosamine-1-phosphate N-acetyltransferase
VKLYLFDDAIAQDWQPFALTRPAGELLFGTQTFRARAERLVGLKCAGHIAAAHLAGFDEPGAAPVVVSASIATTEPRVFIRSRAVIDSAASLPLQTSRTTVIRAGGLVVGLIVPAGEPNPDAAFFAEPELALRSDGIDVRARMIERVWDLVLENAEQIRRDFAAAGAATDNPAMDTIAFTPGQLRLGRNVMIEPHTVFDFSHGAIWLDDDVTVRAFTRLAGPAYVGRGSTLLGGPYDAVSIGPVCRVHGELEESIVLGYSNKAHDGFLGHAYLGRWVNLGAMTTNSDLKNNYGTIRMWTPAGEADTGSIKMGCLLGDHVKLGIGSLINTGTVIGAGSNLFGTEMPPKYVPPFSWGSGSDLGTYDVDKFLAVTATVMGRRKVTLSDDARAMLRGVWHMSAGER